MKLSPKLLSVLAIATTARINTVSRPLLPAKANSSNYITSANAKSFSATAKTLLEQFEQGADGVKLRHE